MIFDLSTRPKTNSLRIIGSGSDGLNGSRGNIRLDGIEFRAVSQRRNHCSSAANVSGVPWLGFRHDLAIGHLAGPTQHQYRIPVAELANQFLLPIVFRI